MKSSQFVKDKQTVLATLQKLPDGSVRTKTGCKIYIPKRFVEKGIAEIGSQNYSLGIFPLVTSDNKFVLFNAIAYMYFEPDEYNSIVIDDEDFIEFVFAPGSIVIKTMRLVQKDTLVYSVFNEFLSNGNIPWYVNYDDSGSLFDTAGTIAGTSIGSNPEDIEILVASISRRQDKRMEYYRSIINNFSDTEKIKPVYVPLKSVTYSATNTTNKLAGAYFDEGIVSALNNPTTRPDTIGTILRK